MEFGLYPEGSCSTDPDTKVWQATEGCYKSSPSLLEGRIKTEGAEKRRQALQEEAL